MKKLLYVSYEDSANRSSGVNKKIFGHMHAFETEGYTADLIAVHGQDIAWFHNDQKTVIKNCLMPRISLCRWAQRNAAKYDVAYIRFQFFCPFTFLMLRSFQANNVITIMEIPTYPYENELRKQGLKGMPKRIIDSFSGPWCAKHIDIFASPLYGKDILGKPCIEIYNGINIDEVTPRTPEKDETIDLIAVAMMAPWHGYERLIHGLHNYYQNNGERNVILHLVGEGAATPGYQELIKRYSLESHVIQHGKKFGDELDRMYDFADIGIGALSSASKKVYRTNTLKVLEYMGKGLPVICEEGEMGIPHDSPYRLTTKTGDEPVDIDDVVAFFDAVYENDITNVIDDIRSYCSENCSIKMGLQGVFNFLQNRNR